MSTKLEKTAGTINPFRGATRVGNQDNIWVDCEGVLYLHQGGKFLPYCVIPVVFNRLTAGDFDKPVIIGDPKVAGSLREVRVHQFGQRNLAVDQDGTLYSIAETKPGCFYGVARGTSKDMHSVFSTGLEQVAYKTAIAG
jgi:hypothetical protein